MKKIAKITKTIGISLLIILVLPLFVYAEKYDADVYKYSQRELEQIKVERKNKLQKIEQEVKPYGSDIDMYARVNVPCFTQIETNYCGPAVVKQTMESVVGRSESQYYYAEKIGTTGAGSSFSDIASYLRENARNSFPDYVYEEIGSYLYWVESIHYCLDRKRKPPVLDVYGFAPGSTGHYINIDIIDIRHDRHDIRVVDPNYDRRYGGYVWYDAHEVYKKNKQHMLSSALW